MMYSEPEEEEETEASEDDDSSDSGYIALGGYPHPSHSASNNQHRKSFSQVCVKTFR